MFKASVITLFILLFSNHGVAQANPALCKSGNQIFYKNLEACEATLGSECPNNLFSSFIREMEYIHLNSNDFIIRAYIAPESDQLETCQNVNLVEDQRYAVSHRMAYPDEVDLVSDLIHAKRPFIGLYAVKSTPSENLNNLNFEIVDPSKIMNASTTKKYKDDTTPIPTGGEAAGGGTIFFEGEPGNRISLDGEDTQNWENSPPPQTEFKEIGI